MRDWSPQPPTRVTGCGATSVTGTASSVDAVNYTLHEVQYRKGDFGSWRVYLQAGRAGPIAALPIDTHGGSTAFANPTASVITTPSGLPGLVVTLFVPFEGAASGEAGELVFYRELGRSP